MAAPWLEKFERFLLGLLMCSVVTGCATRSHVANDYEAVLKETPTPARRTVILFLVDGLSEQTLQAALPHMPNLQSFFKTNEGMHRAHAPFPSLTFPGISSLLKGKPVGQTGFIGNSFFRDGEVVNFENPLRRKAIGDLMETDIVFSRLKASGRRSVSLDYGLGVNASAYSPIEDLASVVNIAQGNYAYVDAKKIEAVELLLSEHPPEDWPSFVFIHLIGVDFLAHSEGPLAASTLGYLIHLDAKLKPLLEFLEAAEKKHQTVTALTADHGFNSTIKYTLDIEHLAAKISKKMEVLNEGRMAAVFLRGASTKEFVADSFLQHKGVELIAVKTGDGFAVESKTSKVEVQLRRASECGDDGIAMSVQQSGWVCPRALNAQAGNFGYPFFLSNLAHYFSADNSPDLVAIPDHETAFSDGYVGYHGGPTADETIVPLLLRNSRMSPGQAPPLWRILNQLVD